MGELYLCSRTEFARAVDLDTGRKIAIIGAPGGFPRWIEKLLPADSCVVKRPVDLASHREFSIIVWWPNLRDIIDEDINTIKGISITGNLWLVIPRIEGKGPSFLNDHGWSLDQERVMMLTPDMDMVPVIFP